MIGATLCSGIGAPEAARPDIDWLWAAEIDPFASRVYAAHHSALNLGDITAADFIERAKAYPAPDVLVAGTPCQAFSVAGLRNSLSDERGNLTLEFVKVVHAVKPFLVLWENVPGVLSTDDNAFGCFLGALVGSDEAISPPAGWTGAGVADGPAGQAAWRILDAQYFGVAQRRRRVFVVFSARTRCAAEILFEWEGLRRDSAPRREAGQGPASGFEVGPSGNRRTEVACMMDARAKDGAIRNQVGMLAMSAIPVLEPGARTGSSTDDPRAGMGIGEDGDPMFTLQAGKQHGVFRMTKFGEYADDGTASAMKRRDYKDATDLIVAHSLSGDGFDASEDGTGRGTPLVAIGISGQLNAAEDIAGPLQVPSASGGGHPAMVAHSLAIRGRDGTPQAELGEDIANAILTPNGGRGGIGVGAAVIPCGVRRLTPVECERLQGFPDGYTALPGAADGPRYRALGNSMAVPVMRWLLNRIEDYLAKNPSAEDGMQLNRADARSGPPLKANHGGQDGGLLHV